MPLNRAELRLFELLNQHNAKNRSQSLEKISIDESRAAIASVFWLARKPSQISYLEKTIIARDGYLIPIRIYNHQLPDDSPVFIYYMGNGYIYDLFKLNSLVCSLIAEHCAVKIVIADMRLAPENPLPTAINDGYDVAKFIATNPQFLMCEPSKITLGGFCSGAACAIAVADLAHRQNEFRLKHLILLNGLFDLTFKNQDYSDYEQEDKSFSKELLDYIITQQNIPNDQLTDVLFSPLYHEKLDHLPATTMIVAEYDRNRSSSEAFYTKLKNNNVDVRRKVLLGQSHNTIIFRSVDDENDDPVKVISNTLNELFNAN